MPPPFYGTAQSHLVAAALPAANTEARKFQLHVLLYLDRNKDPSYVEQTEETLGAFWGPRLDAVHASVHTKVQELSIARGAGLKEDSVCAYFRHEKTLVKVPPYNIKSVVAWRFIEDAMRRAFDRRLAAVRVEIKYRYGFVVQPSAQNSSQSTRQQMRFASLLTPVAPIASFVQSQPHHATNSQLDQMHRDFDRGPHLRTRADLAARWQCETGEHTYCWIDNDKNHDPLDSRALAEWNNMIVTDSTGRITIENPPHAVKEQLRQELKQKRRRECCAEQSRRSSGYNNPI